MTLETTVMRVEELRLGKIVAEDIFANTQYPIIYKNAKINHEHFRLFEMFNLNEILIYKEKELEVLTEEQSEVESTIITLPKYTSFETYYYDAIAQIKKEFGNWQAGAKIDLTKVRGMIIPLIEKVLEDRSYIFDLNTYSNAKDYLFHHCIATGLIASIISKKLGHDRGTIIQVAIAGMLADSGMAKVAPRIRDKQSALTEIEFAEVKKHPYYSYLLVKDLPSIKEVMKVAIYQHHERLNGSGYPKGEKMSAITTFGQIIAVADVFHAMTSERLYRLKQSPFKVIEMIKEEEFGKFDVQVVQALVDLVVDLPIGTKIELSNLELGEVMFINKYAPTRPLVRLINSGEIIDLATNRNFYISRVITK